MTRQLTIRAMGLAIVLIALAQGWAQSSDHPHLADDPANKAWLAPAGTGHLQNLAALDPGQPADVVIRRDKVLGHKLQMALATDAPMLMLVHGPDRLMVRLTGKADVPHVLELRDQPAEVRLDSKVVADADGAWPRMMHIAGDDTLTLRFVGASKLKLQFDSDRIDPKAAASFFGIPTDPSNPAYQKISRQPQPQEPGGSTATPGGVALPPRPQDIAAPRRPVEPLPQIDYVRDYPEVLTADLVASVQPATVVIEARTSRPGVTAVAHGFFASEDGLAVVPLDALADATDLRLSHTATPDLAPATESAQLVAIDAAAGLALVQVKLADGVKATPVKLAQRMPAPNAKLWLVAAAAARDPAFSEATSGGVHALGGTQTLGVRCVMRPSDLGAVIVNPLGEAVGMASWQSGGNMEWHNVAGVGAAATLLKSKPATPPTLAEVRNLRGGGLPGLMPAWLRIDAAQPVTALQRETINLKRGVACRVCDGKGEVDKQIHRQSRGNVGAGKDWYETVKITCPTCQGGKLAPTEAIVRLLEKVADAVAVSDIGDSRWPSMRDFTAQTLDELTRMSPRTLSDGLHQASGSIDPARLRVGQPVQVVGVAQPVLEPALLLGPDNLQIRPARGGPRVIMIGMRLHRGRSNATVLAAGLYAGQVRLPDGSQAVVLLNGLTIPLSAPRDRM